MFPDQQKQGGVPQPQNPYQPPQTGVNSVPQQAPSGQYQVVPPLPTANNSGHSGHNPYEFIVNPNTPKGSVLGGGNSFLLRIGIIGGGVVVLFIIAAVILSSLGPKSITPGMLAIAERQQEIIRVATAASTQATGQDTQNFVANTELSVTSSQQQVLAYLAAHGTKKVGAKQLALDQSAQTDTLLANAATANNYDSAAVQDLTTQLQTYEGLLQTTFKQASSLAAKKVLQSAFDSAAKLLSQAKPLTTSEN